MSLAAQAVQRAGDFVGLMAGAGICKHFADSKARPAVDTESLALFSTSEGEESLCKMVCMHSAFSARAVFQCISCQTEPGEKRS